MDRLKSRLDIIKRKSQQNRREIIIKYEVQSENKLK